MAVAIVVPRLGWSMEEGTFVEWLKRNGERVAAGEMLFVLENEKASQEVESFDAGILHLPPDAPQGGETVTVGQVLGFLLADGEIGPHACTPSAVENVSSANAGAASPSLPVAHQSAAMPAESTRVVAAGAASRIAVTPRARRLARELDVDWKTIPGTGRRGRIRERDVHAAVTGRAAAPAQAQGGQLVSISPLRRTIAERMMAGVHQAAPVTLTTKADATQLVQFRTEIESLAGFRPTYTELLIKLVGAILPQHSQLMTQWRGDALFLPDDVHVAFAVQTDAGLTSPVIRNVPARSLREVANEARNLAELARRNRLQAEHLQGGVFTVTNLGAFGIDAFTPIILLPQTAVLGVGRIVREPAVVNEAIVPRDLVTLSLTFDHRAVDGVPAARFLDALRTAIADPTSWLGEGP